MKYKVTVLDGGVLHNSVITDADLHQISGSWISVTVYPKGDGIAYTISGTLIRLEAISDGEAMQQVLGGML